VALSTERIRWYVRQTLLYVALIVSAAAFLIPLLWMLSTSLKEQGKVMQTPPQFIPNPVDWGNYKEALTAEDFPFLTLLKNTMTYTVFETLGIMIVCPLVAYSFSRLRWPGRDAFFVATLASMMIPGTVTMVPVFIFFKWLNWIGTMLPLIVPGYFGSAFMIFLLRQFFGSIPMELTESALLDGASHLRILWSLIVPLAKPALAAVALFEFLYCWNDFMGPLIYLQSRSLFTFSIGLYAFRERWEIRYDLMMAAATVVTLPILVLFFFAQRTFIEGITLTGMKG
jgi:ABC-type glycerol-3-phosphate transport system permease component